MNDIPKSGTDGIDVAVAHAFNEVVSNAANAMPGRHLAILRDKKYQLRALDVLEESVVQNNETQLPSLSAFEHARDLVDLSQSVDENRYDDKFPELLKSTHFREAVTEVLQFWSSSDVHGRTDDKPHAGALVYLDLDNFKQVNDKYGHNVGDEILSLLSRSMRETMRKQDKLGRLGGEEFAIWFSDSSADAVENAFWKVGDEQGNDDGIFLRINANFSNGLEAIKAKHNIEWQPTMVNGKPTYFSAGLVTISSSEVGPGQERAIYDEKIIEADGRMYANKNRRKVLIKR